MRKRLRSLRRLWKYFSPCGATTLLRVASAGRGQPVAVVPPGSTAPVFLRARSADVLTYGQVFVDEEYAFEPGSTPTTIIDAGANIGLASRWFARRFPGARIVALEPEAENFALLERNVRDHPQITPVQGALWNTSGELALIDPGLGEWGYQTSAAAIRADAPARHRVRAWTVAELLDAHGMVRVDVLKMDIEGAELEVLADAPNWIDRVDLLIVELHEHLRSGCESAWEAAVHGFAHRWTRGENLYAARLPLPGVTAGGQQ